MQNVTWKSVISVALYVLYVLTWLIIKTEKIFHSDFIVMLIVQLCKYI